MFQVRPRIPIASMLACLTLACAETSLYVKMGDAADERACEDQRKQAASYLRQNSGTCKADADCVRLPVYEAGNCQGWVVRSEALRIDEDLLDRVEKSCSKVVELPLPLCPESAPRCVDGLCTGQQGATANASGWRSKGREEMAGDVSPTEVIPGCWASQLVTFINDYQVTGTPVFVEFIVGVDGKPHCFSIAPMPRAPDPSDRFKPLIVESVRRCAWNLGRRGGKPAAMLYNENLTPFARH